MREIDFEIDDEIRIKKIYDYSQIYKVLVEISSAYDPPLITSIKNLPEYALKLSNNAEVLVAGRESILGLIAFYCNDAVNKTGYITQIAVKSTNQSRGIGKRLMNASYSICKENGMRKIKLEVRKSNIKAIKFYEKEGFKGCEDASDFSIYMEKSL